MNGINYTTRSFCRCSTLLKKVPDNLKGRSKSSQEWLTRQINDPYVQKAKMLNYRARSAFKLLEIDDKHKILHPGLTVVECGAAPGAWTQVSVDRINATGSPNKKKGIHVAVDLFPMHPVPGALILAPADFTSAATRQKIAVLLGDRSPDVVLSDMAPRASGVRQLDQDGILSLAQCVVNYATSNCTQGATLLVKLWNGGGFDGLRRQLELRYQTVRIVKPESSRGDSAELFLLARGLNTTCETTKNPSTPPNNKT